MSILLINKGERAILNSVSGVKYYFVACMALCIVYYNFQNCLYALLYSSYYTLKDILFLLKTDSACQIKRYQDTSRSEKGLISLY